MLPDTRDGPLIEPEGRISRALTTAPPSAAVVPSIPRGELAAADADLADLAAAPRRSP